MLREGVHNVVVCDPKWTAKLSVEKCCQVGPGYGGVEGEELVTCCLSLAFLWRGRRARNLLSFFRLSLATIPFTGESDGRGSKRCLPPVFHPSLITCEPKWTAVLPGCGPLCSRIMLWQGAYNVVIWGVW